MLILTKYMYKKLKNNLILNYDIVKGAPCRTGLVNLSRAPDF